MSQQPRPQNANLKRAIDASRSLIGWAIVFGGAVNFLYLAPSLFMMQVYDRVLNSGGVTTLIFLGAVLIAALASLTLLDSARVRLMTRISLRIERLLAPHLLEAVMRQPTGGGDSRRSQALREFDTIRQALTGPAVMAVLDAPWSVIYVGIAFLIHPWLGILTLVGGAGLVILALFNERATRKILEEASALGPRIYAAQEAEGQASEAVRALGMRKVLIDRQLGKRRELNLLQTSALLNASKYTSGTKFLRLLLQSSALALGALLAIEHQISPGSLIAGSILTSRALAPLEQIVGAWRQLMQARSAYREIVKLLEAQPADSNRTALPAPRGALRFERISVRVPDGSRLALNDVSFELPAGEILGIIGPSGAGKSTLARIAVGALAPAAGIVRIDMANIADWDSDQLGQYIGYLPQSPGLLAGSIGENIRRFTPRTPDNETEIDAATIAAASNASIHEFILRLPENYNFPLGLGGSGLSAGQLQRVALARALYNDPTLIVLDEPNAHLDDDGEAALLGVLRAAKARGAACIVIAHRPGVLTACDRVAMMRDGKIESIVPRDEALRRLAGPADAAQNRAPMRPREVLP